MFLCSLCLGLCKQPGGHPHNPIMPYFPLQPISVHSLSLCMGSETLLGGGLLSWRAAWPFQLSTTDKRLGSSRFKSLDCGGSPLAVVGCRTLIDPTPSGTMTMQPLIPEPQGGKGTWERGSDPQTPCTGWGNGNLEKGGENRRKIQVDPWRSGSGASGNDRRKGAAPKPKLLSPPRGNTFALSVQ